MTSTRSDVSRTKMNRNKLSSASYEKQLAQQLREICDKNGKEIDSKKSAKILHKLGQVYRTRTPDFICLIKSAALMNAAIARSPDNVKQIENDLKELCKHVLEIACAENKNADLVSYSELVKQAINKLRNNVDDELSKIKNIPNDVSDEKLEKLEKEKIHNIQTLQDQIAKNYTTIMADLTSYCREILGDAPCQFAIAGMGPLARKEITPYSDFEHIILLENLTKEEKDKAIIYFKWFTVIFQIVLINLQETIIPSVAIATLNDEASKDGNWFFDSITRRGICFDGMMLHACKFPFGRQQPTKRKPWKTELIKPVDEMLQYLSSEEDLKNGYHLSDILTKTCFVCGKQELFEEFESGVFRMLCNQDEKQNQRTIREQLIDDLQKHATRSTVLQINSDHIFNVKKNVYRITSLFTSALGRLHHIQASSSFNIVAELAEKKLISGYAKHKLMYAVALSCEIRLRWYMKNKSQTDHIANEESILTFLNIVGEASSLSYFQISYALQSDISKQFNLHKAHFYSNPLLFNISLLDCFKEEVTLFHYLASQHDFKFNRQRFTNFDECLKSLEATAIVNISDRILISSNSSINQDTVEIYKFQYFFWLGNNLLKLFCFDEALECYEKSLAVLINFLPSDISKILSQTKGESFIDCLLEDLTRRVHDKCASPLSSKNLKNLCINSFSESRIFQLLIWIICLKCYCLNNLEKLVEEKDLLTKALQIFYETNADVCRVELAEILCQLGTSFGRLRARAMLCFEASRKILEALAFTSDKTYAYCLTTTLYSSAKCLLEMNKRSEAERCLERIVQIADQITFNTTPVQYFIITMEKIGIILLKMNKYSKAKGYFTKLLDMQREISNDSHCDRSIASFLVNIGECLENEKKFNEAIRHYEEGLEIIKRTSINIDCDSYVGYIFNNMGMCFTKLHQLDKAECFLKQSLSIQMRYSANADTDVDIARTWNNLGLCFKESNEYEESKKCLEKSLAIQSRKLPDVDESKDFAENLRSLGQCLMKMEKYSEAEKHLKRSLEIQEHIMQNNDCDDSKENVADALQDLGWCAFKMEKFDLGMRYFQRTLDIQEKVSLDVDSDLRFANALKGLGCCFMNISHFEKALLYLKRSLKIIQDTHQSSGDFYSEIDLYMILFQVGKCYKAMDSNKEAKNYLSQSLKIVEKLSSENKEAKQNKPTIEKFFSC